MHIYTLIGCPAVQSRYLWVDLFNLFFLFFSFQFFCMQKCTQLSSLKQTHAEADLLSRHNEGWVCRLGAGSPSSAQKYDLQSVIVCVCVDSGLFTPCFIPLLMALSPSCGGGRRWRRLSVQIHRRPAGDGDCLRVPSGHVRPTQRRSSLPVRRCSRGVTMLALQLSFFHLQVAPLSHVLHGHNCQRIQNPHLNAPAPVVARVRAVFVDHPQRAHHTSGAPSLFACTIDFFFLRLLSGILVNKAIRGPDIWEARDALALALLSGKFTHTASAETPVSFFPLRRESCREAH